MKKNELCLLSIVTVVHNGFDTIEATIKSVLSQSYSNIEYIIIDGGSTDGTIDIIKQYASKISFWVSEKDNGIYDAMNIGIRVASGTHILLLNADDRLSTPDSISLCFQKKPNLENILISDTIYEDRGVPKLWKIKTKKRLFFQIPFMHTSCIIPKSVYNKIGLYNLDFNIASDVDFIMRAYNRNITFEYLDFPIVVMSAGGVSDKNFKLARQEYRGIYITYFRSTIMAWVGYYYSLFDFFFLKALSSYLKGK